MAKQRTTTLVIPYRILLIALAVFILDVITKTIFFNKKSYFITSFINTGASFNILKDNNLLLIIIALIVIVIILKYSKVEEKILQLALGLLLGGTFSNLVDRIFFSGVRDFIDLKLLPVFNLADLANVTAATILIYYIAKK